MTMAAGSAAVSTPSMGGSYVRLMVMLKLHVETV